MGNICCEDKGQEQWRRSIRKVHSKTNHQFSDEEQQQQQPIQHEPDDIIQSNLIKRKGAQKYQSIKLLGRGTYGNIVLAQDKESHQAYAMKIIDKNKIKEFNVLQCQIIKKISQNKLFVTIRETFQNKNLIYLVMEYLSKGDIYFYMDRRECVFTEEIIRDLMSQIIVGIEILHQSGILYRELKPENILVTDEGHIKLTDYGLSKVIIEDKKNFETYFGALEYTAPEVLSGRQYGKQVDLWALGIMMFELRFQKNPYDLKPTDIFQPMDKIVERFNIQEILNDLVGLMSHDFRDILIQLFQKDPQKRISIPELKKHSFFAGVNWELIPERKNPPPLKQFVNNDHIKFRDPTNQIQIAQRRIIQNKNKQFSTNLYQFRSSQ